MNAQEIVAPPQWRSVDFISDLHLHSSNRANFAAWAGFLERSTADAIFILGDLFDVWVGDDVLGSAPSEAGDSENDRSAEFERQCAGKLRGCARQRKIYLMHGNRDFLIGAGFAQAAQVTLLPDPSVFVLGGRRYLLSHGDALCWADVAYQAFRKSVRLDSWQKQFLALPLAERREQARQMRAQSERVKSMQQASGQPALDLDEQATLAWMNALRCTHFIHGHTHEGRDHALVSAQGEGIRHVLPDWQAEQTPPRALVLRVQLNAHDEVMHQHYALV